METEQNLITNEEAFTILCNVPKDEWGYVQSVKKIISIMDFENDKAKTHENKTGFNYPHLSLTLEQKIIEEKFLDKKSRFFKREKAPSHLIQEMITYLLDVTHWAKRGLGNYTQLAKIKIIPANNSFSYVNNLYDNVVRIHQENKIKKEEALRQNAINQTKSYISRLEDINKMKGGRK